MNKNALLKDFFSAPVEMSIFTNSLQVNCWQHLTALTNSRNKLNSSSNRMNCWNALISDT